MNRIFVIGDTHFGHKKIIEMETIRQFATIQQHDDYLVEAWNATVKPNDTVWHLGDVLFGQSSFETLGRLHGIKKLVMGNHDRYPSADYLKHFTQLFGAVKLRDCILTHIPIHPNSVGRFKANIHGHMHSHELSDLRYFNVSAERTNLAPILLDRVVHLIDQRLANVPLLSDSTKE